MSQGTLVGLGNILLADGRLGNEMGNESDESDGSDGSDVCDSACDLVV